MNPDQALLWNAGTCRSDVKGEAQAGDPREGESTDAGHRDGAVRSRDEGSVMELDRRGCGIPPRTGGQPVTGGATWPRQSCWTTKPTAGYWEPDEPRGSRPILRERGGETPPRHSPSSGVGRNICAPQAPLRSSEGSLGVKRASAYHVPIRRTNPVVSCSPF